MHHDFRIVKRNVKGVILYEVHRVFYRDASKTRAYLVENRAATIIGSGPKIMLEDIESMVDAFDKSVIVIPEWDVV